MVCSIGVTAVPQEEVLFELLYIFILGLLLSSLPWREPLAVEGARSAAVVRHRAGDTSLLSFCRYKISYKRKCIKVLHKLF